MRESCVKIGRSSRPSSDSPLIWGTTPDRVPFPVNPASPLRDLGTATALRGGGCPLWWKIKAPDKSLRILLEDPGDRIKYKLPECAAGQGPVIVANVAWQRDLARLSCFRKFP